MSSDHASETGRAGALARRCGAGAELAGALARGLDATMVRVARSGSMLRPLATLMSGLVLSGCGGPECGEWKSHSFDPRLRTLTNKVAVGLGGALAVQQTDRVFTEYQPRDSGTTEDLLDVWADRTYFDCAYVAVGREGTVRLSSDEGERWEAADVPALAADLRGVDVDCGNDRYAVAVGDAGAVVFGPLNTSAPWQVAAPPTSRRLNAVALAIGKRATAVGEGGLVLRSGDGGMTWTEVPVPTTEDLLDIEVDRDAGNGYIVGAAGTLLQSAGDGTWTRVDTGVDDDLRQVVDFGGAVRILGDGRLFVWDFTRTGPLVADHELGRPLLAVVSLGILGSKGSSLHPTDTVLVIAEDGRLLSYLEPAACADEGYY